MTGPQVKKSPMLRGLLLCVQSTKDDSGDRVSQMHSSSYKTYSHQTVHINRYFTHTAAVFSNVSQLLIQNRLGIFTCVQHSIFCRA